MNFNTTTFRQLMGNGLSDRVPQFQRDYSWGTDEWDDLWQDMVGLFGEDPDPRITWATRCCNRPTTERSTFSTRGVHLFGNSGQSHVGKDRLLRKASCLSKKPIRHHSQISRKLRHLDDRQNSFTSELDGRTGIWRVNF